MLHRHSTAGVQSIFYHRERLLCEYVFFTSQANAIATRMLGAVL